jgi:hypothetical protein
MNTEQKIAEDQENLFKNPIPVVEYKGPPVLYYFNGKRGFRVYNGDFKKANRFSRWRVYFKVFFIKVFN